MTGRYDPEPPDDRDDEEDLEALAGDLADRARDHQNTIDDEAER